MAKPKDEYVNLRYQYVEFQVTAAQAAHLAKPKSLPRPYPQAVTVVTSLDRG